MVRSSDEAKTTDGHGMLAIGVRKVLLVIRKVLQGVQSEPGISKKISHLGGQRH